MIDKLPSEIADWITIDSPASMYPIEWNDLGITRWELTTCPWWLDYPRGERHPSEDDLYSEWQRVVKGKSVVLEVPPQGSASRKQSKRHHQSRELRTKKRLDMDTGLDQADDTTPFEERVVEEGSEEIAWKHAIDEIAGRSAGTFNRYTQLCSHNLVLYTLLSA